MKLKTKGNFWAAVAALAATNAWGTGSPDSASSVNDFCQNAQQIIASTDVESTNLTHSMDDSFIQSSPAPYANMPGGNLSAYNGKGDPELLPLTTQQYITYGSGFFGNEYPKIVSCKMKSAEGIQIFIDPSAAGPAMACSDVIADTIDDVFADIPRWWRRLLAFDESQIVIDDDATAMSGPEWLDPFPPTVAYIGNDGLLHLQGKNLIVPVNLPPFIPVGDDKKGVHYCHVPAPSFVERLVKGLAQP